MNRNSSEFRSNHNQASSEAEHLHANDSQTIQHQKIIEQMNQTPKFTEEWFQLKEEEIALRSYLAWSNESSGNIPIQNSSRSADLEAHNNSSKNSEASSSADAMFGHEGCNPPLKNSNTNAAWNELAIHPSCPESLPTLSEMPTDDSPPVPIAQSIEITKHETLRKDGTHPKSEVSDAAVFDQGPCLLSHESSSVPASSYDHKSLDRKEKDCYTEICTIQEDEPPIPAVHGSHAETKLHHTIPPSSSTQTARMESQNAVPPPVFLNRPDMPLTSDHSLSSSSIEEENDHGIVIPEAYLVEDTENSEIQSAEIVEPDKNMFTLTIAGRKVHVCGFIFSAVLIIIALVVGFLVNDRSNTGSGQTTVQASVIVAKPSSQPSMFPSATPTLQPSTFPSATPTLPLRKRLIKNAIEQQYLNQNITLADLSPSDVRIGALNWLLYDDPMMLNVSSSNLFQRYALALLVFPTRSDWTYYNRDECQWGGVSCSDETGKVVSLEFSDTYMGSTIPPEIGMLSSIKEIKMNGCSLYGTLPSELGSLRSLTELLLYENQFTGSIPIELGQLVGLTELILYGNALLGSLPSELGKLMSLTELSVYNNQLTGSIPTELGQLVSLIDLSLNDNSLSGPVPSELGNLNKITTLWLHNNQFTGTFPTELGQLVAMTYLYLGGNFLSGSLPSELGKLMSLTILSVYNNQLTGSIPTELGQLVSLIGLGLNDNSLSGTVPSELGNLDKLMILWLQNNEFTGMFPEDILELNLKDLCLSNNGFTGTPPADINTDGTCDWF